MAKFMTLAALALGFGCSDKDGDSTGSESDADTDADTDTDTDPNVPTDVAIAWSADSVDVTVTGGEGNLIFGITQTGKDPWEAEDGVGGTTGKFGPFYHTVSADDTTTIDCVDAPEDVTDNTSLFCNVVTTNGGDDSLTYYIGTTDDSWCAVAGQDISYYSSHGCDDWSK
jgi:hypothetical protein